MLCIYWSVLWLYASVKRIWMSDPHGKDVKAMGKKDVLLIQADQKIIYIF